MSLSASRRASHRKAACASCGALALVCLMLRTRLAEPAIDAFSISPGVPREPEARREPVLLLLQMTVARSIDRRIVG